MFVETQLSVDRLSFNRSIVLLPVVCRHRHRPHDLKSSSPWQASGMILWDIQHYIRLGAQARGKSHPNLIPKNIPDVKIPRRVFFTSSSPPFSHYPLPLNRRRKLGLQRQWEDRMRNQKFWEM
jgi:hypothetical protein